MDRGPGFRRGVLELVALTDFCPEKQLPAFLREPSKPIELPSSCQAESLFAQGRSNSLLAVHFLFKDADQPGGSQAPSSGIAQRKISNNDQTNVPEPLGFAGDKLLGLAMACSLWDSLQGFRGACLT